MEKSENIVQITFNEFKSLKNNMKLLKDNNKAGVEFENLKKQEVRKVLKCL